MSTAPNAEVSEIDSSARGPLSLLFASALFWLLVSGVLALVNYAQTISPAFLAECPFLSYGRVHAMQETALIYGWVANAGFAVALWLLARLGGTPLRSLNWVVVGGLFWNLGVFLGVGGAGIGEAAAINFLHLPRTVGLLLLVASAAIATPGILAWSGRSRESAFAAQWYAAAALFLFPWLFSAAQVTLLWAPGRGVLQAIGAGWYQQGAWTLWIAPLTLAAAYYLVPKITGKVIPTYNFAALSFWTLLIAGGWTGGRHVIDGPVPAWVGTLAVVASMLLTFHYLIVGLNLRGAFTLGSTALLFVAAGVGSYLIGGAADALTAFRSVAEVTQLTWVTKAQSELALSGAFTLTTFGAIYFIVPRLTNAPWPSISLIRAHLAGALIGTIVLVAALTVAGFVQSHDLAHASTSFADIAAHTKSWLEVAAAGQIVLVFSNALLAVHFLRAVCPKRREAEPAQFRAAPTMEVSVS